MRAVSLTHLHALALALLLGSGASAALDPVVCIPESQFTPPPAAPAATVLASKGPYALYEGATPPGLDPARPVLVFVHGLHGMSEDWWEPTEYYGANDMYDAAYAAGYKTFFVDLVGDGQALDPIENGRRLVKEIALVTSHWGVERVNVIAHSKGGVDSNVAAMMGAPIDTLFTLSSPHHGSPLADLAQSSTFDWLAELLEFNDAGTKSMQTGWMATLRGLADPRPQNQNLSIFTAAATGWGPFLSALEFGGVYLSGACPGGGDNDGLVCVEHAKHPWGRDADGTVSAEHRLVWDPSGSFELDHDSNRMGNAFLDFVFSEDCHVPVFESIEPYVASFHHGAAPLEAGAAAPSSEPQAALLRNILRGGPLQRGTTVERFPIEDGARAIDVRLLAVAPGAKLALIDPRGNAHALPAPRPVDRGLFRGAAVTGISLEGPLPGEWSLRLAATGSGAYALLVRVESDLDLALAAAPDAILREGDPLPLRLRGTVASVETEAAIRRTPPSGLVQKLGTRRFAGPGARTLPLGGPRLYNISVTIRGRTLAGAPFERSRVLSVAIPDPVAPALPSP